MTQNSIQTERVQLVRPRAVLSLNTRRQGFLLLVVAIAALLTAAPRVAFAQETPFAGEVIDSVAASPPVIINEILSNPDLNTEWIEFIELYNPGDLPVSLEDWRISGGVDYLFPKGAAIAPKGYLVIGEAPDHLRTKYGIAALGPYDGGLSSDGEEIVLTDHRAETVDELEYGIGFPWPIPDGDPDRTYQLINAALDNSLGGNWRSNVATPGAANNTLVANPPPTFLSVSHAPQAPKGNEAVTVEARLQDADGIASVRLLYQVIEPGNYVTNQDTLYTTAWTPIAMTDQGEGRYTAIIPANLNRHRNLMRYRVEATDGGGRTQRVPFEDDPQPNFAYFVYNGVPNWTASFNGLAAGGETFHFAAMRPLPVFHFIGKQMDIADALFIPPSTWTSGYMGSDERWRGTLVYDGVVYDHVEFRARGGDFRYATGKSNWRINLHKGHRVQMYDNWGEPYPEVADKINLYGVSQQVHRDRRGEHGMFDSMTYRLYNAAGVAGSNTNWVQLRVIDGVQEFGANQYEGDFWGLYLSVEHPDGSFLDNHGLPDGNLYKIENDQGDLDNLSKNGPADGSDFADFHWAYTYTVPTADWWRGNFDLDNYYSFRSILEFTHDYDVNEGKNYYFFHNDDTDKWMILPWDKDLTWYVNMPGTGIEPIVNHILPRPEFNLEYQNRVRELRDLLLNQEQIFMMLDEYANVIDTPLGTNTIAKADRFMWDYNLVYGTRYVDPYRTKPGHYYISTQEKTFRAMVEQMKQYALQRFSWMDRHLLTDQDFPATPGLAYAGAGGYLADGIFFSAAPFADPQGAHTFGALEWRIAEISIPTAPVSQWNEKRAYEIDALWESGETNQNGGILTPPQGIFVPGHTYRTRVRYKDNTGRWSHWSAPVQFTAAPPASAPAPVVISELMYHPTPNGNWPADELEFVEIYNNGSQPLNLGGWRIEGGIEYLFPQDTRIEPDGYLVIVENEEAFATRYDTAIAGEYDGKLSNGGERITLVDAWGRRIFSVEYSDDDPWPEQADGGGYSLVHMLGAANPDDAAAWRQSVGVNGSPGFAEPTEVVINEIQIAPENARAVELFNPGNAPADVSFWFLSEKYWDQRKAQLPAGSIIPAGGYLVVNAAKLAESGYDGAIDFTPNPNMTLVLSSGRQNGDFTGYQTIVRYGAPDAGRSVGTYVDSQGATQFPLLQQPTLGAVNAPPRVGPIVVSEILYRPAGDTPQYVEITNITNAAVLLGDGDPNTTTQLQGGYFSFPGGFALPAGGRVLVTSGAPHAACTAFADRGYTRILGPFGGRLSADDQTIALYMPSGIGGLVRVDAVAYRGVEPWPALEAGEALLRSNLTTYGNDPANWQAASGVSPQPVASPLCAFTANAAAANVVAADGAEAAAGATVIFTLNDNSGAAGFATLRVVRSTRATGEAWVEIATVAAASQSAPATYTVNDATAQPGQIYYYALEGYTAQGAMISLGMTTTSQPWQTTMLPRVAN